MSNQTKREFSNEDLDFLIDYQYEHGETGSTYLSLPKICSSFDFLALSKPDDKKITQENIETYKNEYRTSIRLKRFVAYGVVASIITLILKVITQSIDAIEGFTNTLFTITAVATFAIFCYYRYMLYTKFEEYGFDTNKTDRKLEGKLNRWNKHIEPFVDSRNDIEKHLANYDTEMVEYMNAFERTNAVVSISLEELEKQKNG